ncbi:MAG: hypothetical protein CMQ24_16790 [Gammaproteobacteria bacterium]|nr:hypothetical protein [Gammaproteobacteria bacterium]
MRDSGRGLPCGVVAWGRHEARWKIGGPGRKLGKPDTALAGLHNSIEPMQRLIAIAACWLLALTPVLTEAATRGIAVNLKGSESKDAAVVDTVELYQESYALIIGIDGYSNGWPRLSNAIKDAELIAALMEERGFNVELHTDLDSADLDKVFKEFFIIRGENEGARLFVWFAGHGATVDGEGFLIPADAPVPNAGPQFKLRSVALRDFGTYMRLATSKHVYAVFDSCFAGTVFASQRALPPAAITHATTLPVRQFLTSGDAAQTVSDDGTFRELFIRAVQGEERSDANADGYVTASELGMFLNDRITNLTASAQTPRYGKLRDKDYDRGDFVFVLPENAQVTGRRLTSRDNSVEIAFWNSIQDSEDPEEFEAYLKSYPLGKFASLAKVKLSQLAKRATRPQQREVFRVTLLDEALEAMRIANVRQTPFPSSPKVGRLQQGDVVWGTGVTQTRGGRWYEVARDGVDLGFVYGPLLTPIASDDQLLPVAGLDPGSVVLPEEEPELRAEESPPVVEAEVVETDGIPETADEILEDFVDDLLQEDVVAPSPVPASGMIPEEAPTVVALATNSAPAAPGQRGLPPTTSAPEPAGRVAVPAQPENSPRVVAAPPPVTPPTVPESTSSAVSGLDDPATAASATSASAASVAATSAAPVEQTPAASDGSAVAAMPAAGPAGDAPPESPAATSMAATSVAATSMAATSAPQVSTASAAATPPVDTSEIAMPDAVTDHGAVVSATESSGSARPSTSATIGELREDATAPPPIGQAGPSPQEPVDATPSETPQVPADDSGSTATAIAAVAASPAVPERAAGVSEYVRRYIEAANGGNSQAQLSLGFMYETGQNVIADVVEAVRWYRRAADNGEVEAQLSLGLLYQKGELIREDPVESARWFRMAANQGHADAQQTLGYFYESGTGVVPDIAEAARWYERAASQGKVAAQNNLGRLYQLGSGVPKDLDKAIYWYEKAAAQGSETATRNLRALLPQ